MIIQITDITGQGRTARCRGSGKFIVSELENPELADVREMNVEDFKESLRNNKIFSLGGDHSASYSSCSGFKDVFLDRFLIVFDAHPDCRLSGAENENWLRRIVQSGWNSQDIILVGLRKIKQDERIFLEEQGIRYFEMRNIESKEDVCDLIMEASQGNNLYVSFDIDVVDPAFAPGTACQEPGGFSSAEILYFARRMARMKNLKAVDIAEVFEDDKLTVKLAARILQEFL